jgi:hypothetical protein
LVATYYICFFLWPQQENNQVLYCASYYASIIIYKSEERNKASMHGLPFGSQAMIPSFVSPTPFLFTPPSTCTTNLSTREREREREREMGSLIEKLGHDLCWVMVSPAIGHFFSCRREDRVHLKKRSSGREGGWRPFSQVGAVKSGVTRD